MIDASGSLTIHLNISLSTLESTMTIISTTTKIGM